MRSDPAVFKRVFVLLSVCIWFSRCESVWLSWPRVAWARTWLITCVLWWKSFKLKQNGAPNVWLHQTCSAQCEVNEMWQTLLSQLRPCNLFHNKVSARPCQCTQLPSLWVNTGWSTVTELIVVPLRQCGHALSACMQCFTETSVSCQNCPHWRNTLL